MPALLIAVPIVLVMILNLPRGGWAGKLAFWAGIALCAAQARLALEPANAFWSLPLHLISDLLRFGISVDDLSHLMFLAIAIVSFTSLMLSRYWCADEKRRFTLVNLIILAAVGMNGIVLSRDLFTLYVFLEVAAVASFVLIAFDRGRDAYEGSFKYIVLSAVATAMILASLALLFLIAGGVSFADAAKVLHDGANTPIGIFAIALFVGGLAIKSGLVPFHGWLPDAYSSAPPPASILLAGIITKTAGVYTLMRLALDVFGLTPAMESALIALGLVSILVGAIAALGQRDMKRMLAYSSISQVGYIILGLGIGTPLGIAGAMFHLFNHAIFKTLLFVNAAAVEKESGTRDMDSLGGIAARMPVTGTTSVIAMLSTSGIPPLSGFWSKLVIIVAAWSAGHHAAATIAILASLLTLAYFLSMQRRIFFGLLNETFANLKEANGWALVPSVLLASATIALGFAGPWLFETFLLPVRSIL